MGKDIGSTSDRPGFTSNRNTTGISNEIKEEFDKILTTFYTEIKDLNTKIKDANQAKEAMLSGMALMEKIVATVADVAVIMRKKPEEAISQKTAKRHIFDRILQGMDHKAIIQELIGV